MKTLLTIAAIALAELGVLWVFTPAKKTECPRVAYSSHVVDCPQCNAIYLGLCGEGERLRKAAVAADGFADPLLDSPEN
jgi:hypothetical protein